MTILYINTGSNPNSSDGDSLRTAFHKINVNFDDVVRQIPTKLSRFTNDTNYITSLGVPKTLSSFTNDTNFITLADVPTELPVSEAGYLNNDGAGNLSWQPVSVGPAGPNPYDMYVWFPYKVSADRVLLNAIIARSIEITGTGYASASVPPTNDITLDIRQNGFSIGTVSYLAETVVGTVSCSTTTFAEGDVLAVVAPSVTDPTLSGISITIKGTR